MVLSQLHLPLLFLLSLSPLDCTYSTDGQPLLHCTLPAVAAARPILEDRAFVVVWNMPTARCRQRYDIHLDLGDFDIVENQQQRFQGEKITIFYRDRDRDHLAKYPYLSRDGRKVNGGIPQLGDLAAHLSLTVAQLSGLLQPNFSGLAVIDWEEWRPLWEENFGSKMKYQRLSKQLVRQESPDLSDRTMTFLAKQNFEESARQFMKETLHSAITRCPRGLWGFYGFPACFNTPKSKTDEIYTGRCHRGMRQQNNRLSWLWSQSTALYPSIYLPQSLAGSTQGALMVRNRLLEALRVASRYQHGNNTDHATPVLSYARLAFTHTLNFLNETDLMHTVGESAALGTAGVVLWGEMNFAKSKRQCILLRDYVHNILGPFIRSLRSDTQRCSFQLCHGNGRCIRRLPGSGHMISSYIDMDSDPYEVSTDSSSVKRFHSHFMCQCYPGWTGSECRVKTKNQNRHEDKT